MSLVLTIWGNLSDHLATIGIVTVVGKVILRTTKCPLPAGRGQPVLSCPIGRFPVSLNFPNLYLSHLIEIRGRVLGNSIKSLISTEGYNILLQRAESHHMRLKEMYI